MSKNKRKDSLGQKYFVDDWLWNPLYKDWLKEDQKDLTIARCYECHKKISLSTPSQSAISDHGSSKKHTNSVEKRLEFFNKTK